MAEIREIELTPAPVERVTVARYRERFTTCASCRAAAVAAIMVDGKLNTTTCARHIETWKRRALTALDAEILRGEA